MDLSVFTTAIIARVSTTRWHTPLAPRRFNTGEAAGPGNTF
jgi:hypothetical protein